MNSARVFLSLTTQDNDYQRAQAAAAQSAARRLGINLEIGYAQGDAVNQSQQILKVIQEKTQKYDAVIFEPVGTGMAQIGRLAASAGIGWIVLNHFADYLGQLRRSTPAPVFEVSEDQHEAGRIQGQQLAALLPEGGTVLYVEGPSISDAARQRSMGMLSMKPANIEIKGLKGNWTEESGQKIVRSWLSLSTSRNMKIGVIACQDDAMALGARKAFAELPTAAESESWLRLPFTGIDGLPETGQESVNRGELAATIIMPPNAGQALELFMKARQSPASVPERTLSTPKSYPSLDELKFRAQRNRKATLR